MKDEIEALLALEDRRIAAAVSGEVDDLLEIFAEDHVHVHGSGKTENRAGLVAAAGLKRYTEPRRPDIRCYGDMAILTGPIILRVDRGEGMERHVMFATQVARRTGGKWQFVSMQVTPIRGG